MEIIYTLSAAFGLAALLCLRGRATAPGMILIAVSLILLMLTPTGASILDFLSSTGTKFAEGTK